MLSYSVVADAPPDHQQSTAKHTPTATPIEHLVVIFDENISFDHYFGTYPHAKNPADEPKFTALPETPSVNGLSEALLKHNPNVANPHRLGRSQTLTCDQNHGYTAEQKAFDHGLMDKFVQYTSGARCQDKTLVMGYFDGNVVTALWNDAQRFAMSDNSFDMAFGPSTPGAIGLISGQRHGVSPSPIEDNVSNGTLIGDPEPKYDDCASAKKAKVSFSGKNVGNLLNEKGVTWGWFEGGFKPSSRSNGQPVCGTKHKNIGYVTVSDYSPHHEPFQYYKSTANPHHRPPSSIAKIGRDDQANHQYDLSDFWHAADAGHLPAVSYLKAPKFEDGHAGYSDPLDEQRFLVKTINHLQTLPAWKHTAVIIAYDDSDGWYDHVLGPIVHQSNDRKYDALTAPGHCGTAKPDQYQDLCGYGPRLPLLVISPYSKRNFVDHSVTDQTSILRFIEDNWHLGRLGDQSFDAKAGTLNNMFDFSHKPRLDKLLLNPSTGEPEK